MKKIIVWGILSMLFIISANADVVIMECVNWDNECLRRNHKTWSWIEAQFRDPCCNRYSRWEKGSSRIKNTRPDFTQTQYVSMMGVFLFVVFLWVLLYRRKNLTSKKEKNDN